MRGNNPGKSGLFLFIHKNISILKALNQTHTSPSGAGPVDCGDAMIAIAAQAGYRPRVNGLG